MRLRKLTAAALAVLAVTGLAACKSKAGAAAVVDGHRISDSDVNKYVSSSGPSADAVKRAAAQSQQLPPAKATVTRYLVQAAVFSSALRKTDGIPDDAALAALHDEALATLVQAQQTGPEFDKTLADEVAAEGFTRSFASVFIRAIELEWALIKRTKVQSPAELAAAVAKLHISVSVSPRYGKWDPANLDLSDASKTLPDFLKLSGTTAASSQAPAS